MKKKMLCILFSLFFVGASVFAASGKAVIPHHNSIYTSASEYAMSYIFISNVTGSSITVTITLYDKDGTIIQDGDDNTGSGILRGSSGLSVYDDNPSGASITFDLAANSTGYIYIQPSTNPYGYGTIEWTQSGSAVNGLVAHGFYVRYKASAYVESRLPININDGKPF